MGRHQEAGLLLGQLREVGKAGVRDNPQTPALASGRSWATHQVLNTGAAGAGVQGKKVHSMLLSQRF